MAVFNREFRSAGAPWIARFLGGPDNASGPSVPMQAIALTPDTPVSADNPFPTADAALTAAVLSLVNQQVADAPGGGAISVPADDPTDVVAAASTPRAVRLYLRSIPGGDYVTFRTGADATGATTERQLMVGERVTLFDGRKFTDRVSVFATYPAVIEVEFWG